MLLLLGGLWLALDGDLFWDEPGYLYVGAYVDGPDLLRGTYQPSEIDDFYLPKIMHVLLVKAVVTAVDAGPTALAVIMLTYAMLIGLSLLLMAAVLRRLLPDSRSVAAAVALTALTPVVLYLSFKTLPEAPALFFATLALYALIRSVPDAAAVATSHTRNRGRSAAGWIALSAAALTAMALNRYNLGALFAFFVVAAAFFPLPAIPRGRLLAHAAIITLLAGVGTAVALALLGIEPARFLGANALLDKKVSVLFRLASTACELGVLWLVLPMAFLVRRHRQAAFFVAWFGLATIPMLLMFDHVESRYLITNLLPFAGLLAMVIDNMRLRWRRLVIRRPARTLVTGLLGAGLLLAAHWTALRLMPAEVNIWRMHALLRQIDHALSIQVPTPTPSQTQTQIQTQDYAILTAWTTTDFYYLRFVYPERPVFNVSDEPVNIMRSDEDRQAMEDRYFRHRLIRSSRGLAELPPLRVYIGYGESFMVANARKALGMLPKVDADQLIPSDQFINHLATSWMWADPSIAYTPLTDAGHYRAYLAQPAGPDAPSLDIAQSVRSAQAEDLDERSE